MNTGTVKFFNTTKGFGFITQEAGSDIFFHVSELRNGHVTDGDKVDFEIGDSQKGPVAVNIREQGAYL